MHANAAVDVVLGDGLARQKSGRGSTSIGNIDHAIAAVDQVRRVSDLINGPSRVAGAASPGPNANAESRASRK